MSDSPPFAFSPMARGHFLNRRNRKLYRALHLPQGAPRRVWLMVPPLFEDACFSQRSMAEMADVAARMGDAVCRFDYEGHGDSEDSDDDLGLSHWAADCEDALRFADAHLELGAEVERVLVAWGSGSLVAAMAALHCPGPLRLVLVDPVLSGRQYLQDALAAHTTMQLSCFNRVKQSAGKLIAHMRQGRRVNLHGHPVGAEFAARIEAVKLEDLLAASKVEADLIDALRAGRSERRMAMHRRAGTERVRVHSCHVPSFLDRSARFWELPVALRDAVLACVDPRQHGGAVAA